MFHYIVSIRHVHIRHMKEGRMKNQAFITFPNLKWASIALEEVHGYLLKDKPMILVSSFFFLF